MMESKVPQNLRATRLRKLVAEMKAAAETDLVGLWVETGTVLIDAKVHECNNNDQRFSDYLAENCPDLSKDDRAACMGLARSPEAQAAARRDHAHSRSVLQVWRNVRHLEVSTCVETTSQQTQQSATDDNPAPAPAATETGVADCATEMNPLAAQEAKSTRGAKTILFTAWADVGHRIHGAYQDHQARSVWNGLTRKKHGIEVAKYALGMIDDGSLSLPRAASVKKPNARLLLPWLFSPFADDYDLASPKGFQKFKDDRALIEQVCRPVFDRKQSDRGNECVLLFRRAVRDREDAARAAGIQQQREIERIAVNTEGHPPILVHGVELWPDGDQAEHLRLSYDEARFAYYYWNEWDAGIAVGIKDTKERGSFWCQRQRTFHDLNFPKGLALSNFWHRVGQAMIAFPDRGDASRCESPR